MTDVPTKVDRSTLLERMHWITEQFTFTSPEVFEERRGEPWFGPDTRAHRVTPQGISRERRVDEPVEITDATAEVAAGLVVGQTIIGFHREPSDGSGDWTTGEHTVTLTLDDGATLTFFGWGHDASGVDTTYAPPAQ